MINYEVYIIGIRFLNLSDNLKILSDLSFKQLPERMAVIMGTCNNSPSILCTVKECAYNTDGEKCTASEIKVGSCKSYCSSCDTECITFKPCK